MRKRIIELVDGKVVKGGIVDEGLDEDKVLVDKGAATVESNDEVYGTAEKDKDEGNEKKKGKKIKIKVEGK